MLLSAKDSELMAATVAGSLPTIGEMDPRPDDALAPSLAVWGLAESELPQAGAFFEDLRDASVQLHPGARTKLFTGIMPRAVLDSLALTDHETDPTAIDLAKQLGSAFDLLASVDEDHFQSVANGIDTLIPVQLRKNCVVSTPLTSITVPSFPLSSFFSRNALRHLAPSALTEKDSVAVLAENLLHESVHQRVNLTIIERSVMMDGFSSATSSKIEIPWRKTAAEERNRAWELDRCLHAFAVYVGVFPFRMAIAKHPQMDKDTKHAFVTSISQAEKSMRFLGSALMERRDQFGPDGQSLIEELQAANPFAE
jgi:hypothetical protein